MFDSLRSASRSRDATPSGWELSLLLRSFATLHERTGSEDVRLLHLVMNWRPSLTNSRGISRNSFAWSIARDVLCLVCWRVCELFWREFGWSDRRVKSVLDWFVVCGGVCSEVLQWWSD